MSTRQGNDGCAANVPAVDAEGVSLNSDGANVAACEQHQQAYIGVDWGVGDYTAVTTYVLPPDPDSEFKEHARRSKRQLLDGAQLARDVVSPGPGLLSRDVFDKFHDAAMEESRTPWRRERDLSEMWVRTGRGFELAGASSRLLAIPREDRTVRSEHRHGPGARTSRRRIAHLLRNMESIESRLRPADESPGPAIRAAREIARLLKLIPEFAIVGWQVLWDPSHGGVAERSGGDRKVVVFLNGAGAYDTTVNTASYGNTCYDRLLRRDGESLYSLMLRANDLLEPPRD